MKRTILILSLILAAAATAWAVDKPEPQVMLESKIIYVKDQGRDLGVQWAIAATPQTDGKTKYEVSTVATGFGADYRNWIPKDTELIPVGGGKPVLPELEVKTYIDKRGNLQMLAVPLFAAIGSQYVGQAGHAGDHPGTACPVTGASTGGSREHTGIHEGIDRVGMAAGMGMLASQAKGQIEGRKYTFLSDIPLTNALFRTRVENKKNHQMLVFITPKVITPE